MSQCVQGHMAVIDVSRPIKFEILPMEFHIFKRVGIDANIVETLCCRIRWPSQLVFREGPFEE